MPLFHNRSHIVHEGVHRHAYSIYLYSEINQITLSRYALATLRAVSFLFDRHRLRKIFTRNSFFTILYSFMLFLNFLVQCTRFRRFLRIIINTWSYRCSSRQNMFSIGDLFLILLYSYTSNYLLLCLVLLIWYQYLRNIYMQYTISSISNASFI